MHGLISTDPTQEECSRSCRIDESHLATCARSHKIGTRIASKDPDRYVGIDDLSEVQSFSRILSRGVGS